MISEYVKEQRRYTLSELCDLLYCSEIQAVAIIKKLKEFGLLKIVQAFDSQKDMSELLEEDIVITDVDVADVDYYYVFTFVGIVVIAGRVLKCYPKYINKTNEPFDELKLIVKVLEKYNSQEQIVRFFSDSSNKSFNLLAVLLYLMKDYYDYGIYSNDEEIIESNGLGEILWDKTINETFALLSNNKPYYFDLQTKKRRQDEFDFITQLHECILSRASRELAAAGLLELFDLVEVSLTEKELDSFGDTDYLLDRISKELNTQFNTRKQLLLKTMYAYVAHDGTLFEIDGISLFGTNCFNLVWETVCSEVLDNKLKAPIGQLELPLPLRKSFDPKTRLIDLIEKPYWTFTGNSAKDTLIPDLVTIFNNSEGCHFYIFDAKYYVAQLLPALPPKGQPGIESIIKQYIYQLAFSDFLKAQGLTSIKNCFLLPTDSMDIVDKGAVTMKMFKSLGLQDICVRLMPAEKVYMCYLSNNTIDLAMLRL